MKSVSRFSVWIVFAGVLCLAPCASGQDKFNSRVTSSGNSVLNASAEFLAFVLSPVSAHKVVNNDQVGTACGNPGEGSDDRRWGGACTPVPEGGTALTYLLFAGLCCMGAIILRSQRKASARETE